MSSNHVWKTELYDSKLGYVSEYGKGVVELLSPARGEKILDLGCGTGDLAYEISKSGAVVTGMDLSAEMIGKARNKYPDIPFAVGDAEKFRLDESFDAVFSNAALHWMKNAGQVLNCVWNALNPGGRFAAEFGGRGNVARVTNAIFEVLEEECGIDASGLNPWFFPSIAEYSTLLEQQGFHVAYAAHFDRPTRMENGENGLNHWLAGFAEVFFKAFDEEDKKVLFEKTADKVRKELFKDGSWYVDYKRIRFLAIKPA
ncbi:trans-aconitate 2-methyltransferase [Paenibacillus tarimensis]